MSSDHIIRIEPLCVAQDKAAQLLDVSASTFQALTRTEPLLKPILVGARNARYPLANLREYVATRPASHLAPPVGSGHGRKGRVAA